MPSRETMAMIEGMGFKVTINGYSSDGIPIYEVTKKSVLEGASYRRNVLGEWVVENAD